jgi:hypothetical protein
MEYWDLAFNTLIDSAEIFGIALALYVLLSFFEAKIARLLEKRKKYGPFFGSLAGVIPQCGISVVGADLYVKEHITMGTLIAIFIACSDEALPILFGNFTGSWYMAFFLIGIKIVGGCLAGMLVDLIYRKGDVEVEKHLEICQGEVCLNHGCCGHQIEENAQENPWHEHLVHPLVHSLKIFAYAFAIAFFFGCLVIWIGQDNLSTFLTANYYFSPLYAMVIGLIPNCASSVLISDLYLKGALPFGALVAGLSVNAGLGPLYLFKNKKTVAKGLIIEGLLIVFGLGLGYAFIWVR